MNTIEIIQLKLVFLQMTDNNCHFVKIKDIWNVIFCAKKVKFFQEFYFNFKVEIYFFKK